MLFAPVLYCFNFVERKVGGKPQTAFDVFERDG